MAFVAPGKTSRSQVRHPDSGLIRQWARPSRRFTARTHLDRGIFSESQVQAAVFRVWLHGFTPVKAAKRSMSVSNAFLAGMSSGAAP
jgi:hypothetical protein